MPACPYALDRAQAYLPALPINRSAAPAPIEESDSTATEAPKKEEPVVAAPAAVEAVKAEEKKADEEVETKTAEYVPSLSLSPRIDD